MNSAIFNQSTPRVFRGPRSLHFPSRLKIRFLLTACCLIFLAVTVFLGIEMHVRNYLSAAIYALPTLAQGSLAANTESTVDDPFQVYTISAENITAKFIPYGARLTSVLVPDRSGNVQDVVMGYDDPKQYLTDTETSHTYFGAIVGRYANRIKNGTFTIDGVEYHVPENENGGIDTLHGGFVGYDQRNWTVTAHTTTSVTFTLLDKGFESFPGDVITHATYTVDTKVTSENPRGLPQLTSKLISLALTEKTPIMLANHIYWNLNAYKESTVLNDTFLQLPLSHRLIAGDSILIPNGTILETADSYGGSVDFTAGKLVGEHIKDTYGLCGDDCTGYDTCFLVDRPPWYPATPNTLVPVLRMNSSTTGISLEVSTNQAALQIFTCDSQNGTIPIKPSQVKRNEADGHGGTKYLNQYGCVVVETEGWIDGINNPQWGQLPYQVYSPEDGPAINWATYKFGTIE